MDNSSTSGLKTPTSISLSFWGERELSALTLFECLGFCKALLDISSLVSSSPILKSSPPLISNFYI